MPDFCGVKMEKCMKASMVEKVIYRYLINAWNPGVGFTTPTWFTPIS